MSQKMCLGSSHGNECQGQATHAFGPNTTKQSKARKDMEIMSQRTRCTHSLLRKPRQAHTQWLDNQGVPLDDLFFPKKVDKSFDMPTVRNALSQRWNPVTIFAFAYVRFGCRSYSSKASAAPMVLFLPNRLGIAVTSCREFQVVLF